MGTRSRSTLLTFCLRQRFLKSCEERYAKWREDAVRAHGEEKKEDLRWPGSSSRCNACKTSEPRPRWANGHAERAASSLSKWRPGMLQSVSRIGGLLYSCGLRAVSGLIDLTAAEVTASTETMKAICFRAMI